MPSSASGVASGPRTRRRCRSRRPLRRRGARTSPSVPDHRSDLDTSPAPRHLTPQNRRHKVLEATRKACDLCRRSQTAPAAGPETRALSLIAHSHRRLRPPRTAIASLLGAVIDDQCARFVAIPGHRRRRPPDADLGVEVRIARIVAILGPLRGRRLPALVIPALILDIVQLRSPATAAAASC